jgi:hypothetical protein
VLLAGVVLLHCAAACDVRPAKRNRKTAAVATELRLR